MANKQIVFADRLVGLSLQNGLVRLDFAVNAGAVKGKDGKAAQRMDITTQLVMPLEAFGAAVMQQEKLVKELVSRGKKQREAKAAKSAEAAPVEFKVPDVQA